MSSRDAILQRIRTYLADQSTNASRRCPVGARPPVYPPPVPEVWPRTSPTAEQLVERFTNELQAVQGEVVRCGSMEEAQRKLADLLEESRWKVIGSVDRPICHQVTAELPSDCVAWAKDDWDPNSMAQLAVGLVAAEYLLADTGTCVVACGTPEERLMCYLPPACVVIARVEQLSEHMPAAWEEIARQTADPRRRGEFVLITGPSRTADIEKILILGVHGPKRLVVMLVG